MKAKARVLKIHPTAALVVLAKYPDGTPSYFRAVDRSDGTTLDIHTPESGNQGPTAAWKSAYFHCVRQRKA